MASESVVDREAVVDESEIGAAHKPYISATEMLPEFTPRAVLLGAILGLIFGASSVYLALKVGLTVSASIPIAVLSISILRLFGRATILENNIVQTTGSAGESIAAGVVFTIPALLILGLDLDITRTSLIALTGGLLGVLLMIPLRRSLIVKEHGNLPYPEGTACAEVLIVGEKGGTDARTVFLGFGVGIVYKLLMAGFKFWKEIPDKVLGWYQNARVAAEISPELLGVGYIIGPRIASYMFGGGLLAALVMVPAIKFFGSGWETPLFPVTSSASLIKNMSAAQIQDWYVRYIAAGAVAAGGIISLMRALPTIISAFRAGIKDFQGARAGAAAIQARTERDIPMPYVIAGVILLLIFITLLPQLNVDWLSAILILIFGFFFVTVSSRITGQIGSSSNPISGMTIATLLFTSLIFLILGRAGADERVIALTVGAIVCVAAANAGATSQDLKTGFLVGATPRRQQLGLLVGATTSALIVGWTLMFLNNSAVNLLPVSYPDFRAQAGQIGERWSERWQPEDGKTYNVLRLPVETSDGAGGRIPAGKYLVDQQGEIHYLVNPGVGGIEQTLTKSGLPDMTFTDGPNVTRSGQMRGLDDKLYQLVSVRGLGEAERRFLVDESGRPHYEVVSTLKYPAPKAALMGILVDGVLTQKLPWALVLIGAFISITLEIIGVHALPVAVGMYLPISTSATIFAGGAVRALVERLQNTGNQTDVEAETGSGVLLSSGLIAGGAIGGLTIAGLRVGFGEERLSLGPQLLGSLTENNIIALIIFAALAYLLFTVARRRRIGV